MAHCQNTEKSLVGRDVFLTDTGVNSDIGMELWGGPETTGLRVPDGICPHVGVECAFWAVGCRLGPCGCESGLTGANQELVGS